MRTGVVIDTRAPDTFTSAHIAGSFNIWLAGVSSFSSWVADETTPIFLVVEEPSQLPLALSALARIGIDSVKGVLSGGISAWREAGLPIETLGVTSARESARWLEEGSAVILDVRDDMEWQEKRIPQATHTFVGYLPENPPPLPKDQRIVVHCSVGHRAGLAASILKRLGFDQVFNMLGGLTAWEKLALPLDKKPPQSNT